MILLVKNLHAGADVPGLASSKAAGADDLLDLVHICFRQCLHIRKLFVEILDYHIDSGVGTLSRKADTD